MKYIHPQVNPAALAIIFLGAMILPLAAADPTARSNSNLTNLGEFPAPTASYQVVQRTANSQVWERTVLEHSTTGNLEPRIHHYTELATGLNYLKDGQWVTARAQINLLPDGRAAATQGQHQTYFPADIYSGQIESVPPDGEHLRSRPIGLTYGDGSNTVFIAELKDATGFLVGSNQIIYPDAFNGCPADLRYTYTLAGLEQDVILRGQPPRPETLGLNPQTTRLQVLTEFFDTPEPAVTAQPSHSPAGLIDHQLTFGKMKMIPGRAFALDGSAASAWQDVPVYKSWHHEGTRAYLMEEVALQQIAPELTKLPAATLPATFTRIPARTNGQFAAAGFLPPYYAPNPATGQKIQLARAGQGENRGFVLDYITISFTDVTTNYIFRSDTTYFVSGAYFQDTGTDVFEGGTVIKFDVTSASLNLTGPQVITQTAPYRPAILTAKDDNSVGETIAGSTGTPSGYYGLPSAAVYIAITGTGISLHDMRMSYLATPMKLLVEYPVLNNLQFVDCNTAMKLGWAALTINNALFDNVNFAFVGAGGTSTVNGTFLTTHNCGTLAGTGLGSVTLANSLLVTTTNLLASTATTLMTNSVALAASDAGIFQTVGAGTHYLAAGSPFQNAGTTNINPAILAGIAARTTYPPALLTNTVLSAPELLTPQAPRNTGLPDLGYHYAPLDYLADGVVVNNTTLSLTNGVAIASFNRPGITLQNGASLVSVGTPLQPNWFVRYQSVQEQSVSLGGTTNQSGQNIATVWSVANPPSGWFSFSDFSAPASGGIQFNDAGASAYGSLTLQNSELWGGTNIFSGADTASTALIKNNLFYRTTMFASNASPLVSLALSNNLLAQSTITLIQPPAGSWSFYNNDVDNSLLTTNSLINSDYNAYINCPFALAGPNNVILTTNLTYQSGPLGNYYQPAGSPLINAGSTTADLSGFYHFTTQTNQIKETNFVLDIGYHYVALDANSNPLDNNADGIPDYAEDADGNGLVDNGEQPWMALPAITTQPVNEVLYPGTNIIFSATVTGVAVTLQWYDNANPLPGATNATLYLNNVQLTDAGAYSLIATNQAGAVTSSNAVLAVLAPPTILTQPTNQAVLQTKLAAFAVTAQGMNLNYQWYSNSVAIPGATGTNLDLWVTTTNASGYYSVIVTNAAGATVSSNALLTVLAITNQPVICAVSASFNDVSQAVASATNGDLVLIPPGTEVWTQTLFLNGVSLRGCGTNQTIIVDGVPATENYGTIINMSAGTNTLTELSNFQIVSCTSNFFANYEGEVVASGTPATPWRIDHMLFNSLYGKNIATYGTAPSVIDHNVFLTCNVGIWTADGGDQYASYSLPATYGLGSSNELYIEDNCFTNIIGVPMQVIDGCGGARTVFRYNTVWNDMCGNHGTETGGALRSQRSMEIYGNTFNFCPGIANVNYAYFTMCMFRGGSALVYSNTANGFRSLIDICNYRYTDSFSGKYYPYGGANGLNPWDSNNPALLLSGHHTGTNGAPFLQVAGANWTVNQWVGCTLNNTNSGLFSEVGTNSADTMYFFPSHNTNLTFNNGDAFTLYQVYAAIDQPGRGSGDLLQQNGYDANGNLVIINTTTGTPSWPHQVIEPMYFWGNLLNGAPAEASSPYGNILAGRDFYNDTPMPGYTAYPYPHPLTKLGVQ